MLRSMQLENFKAFGQRTVIPLAPITLIFGQNSSGKSSILQSLNLLKQSRESRDTEALLQPRTENGLVDLGSFQEMLFDHDLRNSLCIQLEITTPERMPSTRLRAFPGLDSLAIETQFVRRTLDEEVSLDKLRLFSHGQWIADFEPTTLPEDVRIFGPRYMRFEQWRTASKLQAMACNAITDSHAFWQNSLRLVLKRQNQILKTIVGVRNSKRWSRTPDLFEEHPQSNKQAITKRLDDAIKLFSEAEPGQIVEWIRKDMAGSLIALDGFIPANTFPSEEPSLETLLSRFGARPTLPPDWYPNVARLAVFVGGLLERTLTRLFPLGPFRKPASRLYIFTGTTPHDVGYHGQLLPDLLFRHPELITSTNEWLERLDVGYQLQIRSLGEHMTDLFDVRLRDMRRGGEVLVGLTDVGFGISQILPLVVQSLAGRGQIITIEQPEVHIHPRLQADLGDLLIEAIREPRRNQFIIETHSEHIALRLQRRVRERRLSPDEISIVYVSRGPSGATVQPLRLDEEGDFIDDFPGGFFPERLRELR